MQNEFVTRTEKEGAATFVFANEAKTFLEYPPRLSLCEIEMPSASALALTSLSPSLPKYERL